MLKPFIYLSVVLLAMALAFSVGVRRIAADPGASVAFYSGLNYGFVLTSAGEVYGNFPDGFRRCPSYDPPVPISEIRFWGVASLMTVNGDVWIWDNGWINIGPVPGTVAVRPSTWGQVKHRAGQ